MGNYCFGLHTGHLTKKADTIAKRHDATHHNYTEANGIKRGWFACDNLGHPFDRAIADAVLDDIDKAGGFDALRRK